MSDSIEKIADEMRTRYGACPATIAAHAVDVAAMLTRWADRISALGGACTTRLAVLELDIDSLIGAVACDGSKGGAVAETIKRRIADARREEALGREEWEKANASCSYQDCNCEAGELPACAANPAPPTSVKPAPNWCRTCGKHRNDRMALLCVDRIHPHNASKEATPAQAGAEDGCEDEGCPHYGTNHGHSCGGCGESDPMKRCIGCQHQFRPQNDPVAWVRRHPDGALTNQFLGHAVIEPVRMNSGAWVPLYTADSLARRGGS